VILDKNVAVWGKSSDTSITSVSSCLEQKKFERS